MQFPVGGCFIQVGLYVVSFFFINHCYSTLILFSFLFRKEQHITKNEIQQVVQQLEQQFEEFDSSPENLSAENVATIVAKLLPKRLL